MNRYLKINPEVAEALRHHRPVVALESTIIAHGMPYPENVATALACEKVIREAGCVPATIALLGGRIVVGLDPSEIETLGKAGLSAYKTSRRDIPYVLANRIPGALTVSGTMIACSLAGIRIFATGGLGGVHRGAEVSMDISADLDELAKTSVLVVCAGAKAILDLPRTLEYLETKGVPVIGYQTKKLPAFYTRSSAFEVDFRMETPEAIAHMAKIKWGLGMEGGIVVANPVPEALSLDQDQIEKTIEEALKDLQEAGIHGKETTPFLLKRVAEKTGGESLRTNIALVLNNCRLAAEIAKAYHQSEE